MTRDRYRMLDTPTGPFALIAHADGSLETGWVPGGRADARLTGLVRDDAVLPELAGRLAAYFDDADVDFSDVPLPAGGGAFHRRCREACRAIPRGETRTYAELARAAGGSTGAARAAGQAMRTNPLPIIVPCHRVVAAGGRLGGFSGSDDPTSLTLDVKRWLLRHEASPALVATA